MDQNNPYAAPQVALVDTQAARQLPGWAAGHLQLLGWLSLVSLLGTIALLVLTLLAGEDSASTMTRVTQGLGFAVVLLGCYLLLRFRRFAEQRFTATGLALPVWLVVALSLLLESLDLFWGDTVFAALGWQMAAYLGGVALMGVFTVWLGICLLKTPDVYPVYRVMAWLEIAGGVMFISVVLALVAVLPLLGASLCMMLVFFRAAEELQETPTVQ